MSSPTHNFARAFSRRAAATDVGNYRRLLIVLVQLALFVVAYVLSFALRFDFAPPHAMLAMALQSLALVVGVQLAVFQLFGLLAGWWRYVGTSDIWDISKATLVSQAILLPILAAIFGPHGFPRSVTVTDFGFVILLTGGARIAVRTYTDLAQRHAPTRNTLVVGAGQAGSNLVRELKRNPDLALRPVAFVDDDTSKRGLRIHGVRVAGTCEALPQLIKTYAVQYVLIALPSATGAQVQSIIRRCRECNVEFLIVPAAQERIRGREMAQQVRSLRLEDLLGRDPVTLDLQSIRAKVSGKTLLITGAAGSIGSELARQIARFSPRRVIVLDRSENDLFRLCTELDSNFPTLDYVPVIGDILDVVCLRDVFAEYHPDSVFHAAAYKHVPMMERHCFQAVTNNILGSYNVALLARQFGVDDFVLISSDKAVRPTNVMGVTKRVAELIVLALRKQSTRFIAVRFGNVLGSNGSVVPLFQQQIAAGGPITVTHPDATRYFMTIPEAVQLVLQASAIGQGGEIFLLDMGEPVRIVDLANNLIRLSTPADGAKIELIFTGLRPGEKLHEELMVAGEGVKPTSNPKIRVLAGGEVDFAAVRAFVEELAALAEAKNIGGLVRKLCEIVPEYTPSPDLLATCAPDPYDVLARYKQARASLVLNDTASDITTGAVDAA